MARVLERELDQVLQTETHHPGLIEIGTSLLLTQLQKGGLDLERMLEERLGRRVLMEDAPNLRATRQMKQIQPHLTNLHRDQCGIEHVQTFLPKQLSHRPVRQYPENALILVLAQVEDLAMK